MGPDPAPVRAAVAELDAEFTSCSSPEDALALLRRQPPRVVLLHTPSGAQWLPMLRSNHSSALYVLLAHPPQTTSERTHPWRLRDGVLEIPSDLWRGESASLSNAVSHLAGNVAVSGHRRWILLNLDGEGAWSRSYGWTAFTGQSEEAADGFGWHDMLEEPQRWRDSLRGSDHVQVELRLFNCLTRQYHRCLFRCVRTVGWTVHIDDQEADESQARQVERLEAQIARLQSEARLAEREVVRLETVLAEERQRRARLEESLRDGAPMGLAAKALSRVHEQLQVAEDSVATLRGAPDQSARRAALDAVKLSVVSARKRAHAEQRRLRLLARPLKVRTLSIRELVGHLTPGRMEARGEMDAQVTVDAESFREVLELIDAPVDGASVRLSVQNDGPVVYVTLRPVPEALVLLLRAVVLRHGGAFGLSTSEGGETGAGQGVWLGLPAAGG